ncbi:hypothetical protein A2630_00775 [Candidatus Woesebacteria bacterium RIFCSPHIGHO2_01_FULL_44_10]|uniref:Uncharacterized protein n=1 Tax=Candidatus Woesebacteria bacterium RIFCSPLOWO2_01_FULL_44_14 TaxID=1802525 RepID=A0A1F8C1N3_9BACT|nr:MAG: hypothetical protein A2630_00775 [Candidatus Woesebacteria bacterium RIFCSPHIGHO2_01_FULL_44_10]OGM54344.1 MAG: hypothetical protein A3F62_01150 [Candidatus Woesebacteria bacterium RIFCSPHIGHO2_12_FULL_44_11]OGM70246.1 MAG: hypothetical protein A2975_04200 [Candidatus Woesebacteria bacterium RIFCSPLOWO2_01_FULL_44_14]
MSKIFYDSLLDLSDVEKHISKVAQTQEEKEELWQIVDELIHHKIVGCILDNLHSDHHEEFLDKFHLNPYDESIIQYLNEKIDSDAGQLIRDQVKVINSLLLS